MGTFLNEKGQRVDFGISTFQSKNKQERQKILVNSCYRIITNV